ncbi:MAG: hypothetical protein ACQETE_11245 [Bacteroidota bacterium]
MRQLLIILMIFQGLSGFYGGGSLLIDPSGEILGLSITLLKSTPFSTFLFPGIVLFFLLGLLPLWVAYGLIQGIECPWLNRINLYDNRHWAWTSSIYIGLMLIIWIQVQIVLLGYSSVLQPLYAFTGISILIIAWYPSVMRYYEQ